jgi:hypothetical protein
MRYAPNGLVTAAAILISLLIGGCATQAQRQFIAIRTGNQVVLTQYIACVTAVYNAPEAEPVRSHSPIKPEEISLIQLSDTSLATKPEVNAIIQQHQKLKECQNTALTGFMNSAPSFVPILTASYDKSDDDIILLVQRKIT